MDSTLTRIAAVATALLAFGVAPLDDGGGGHEGHEDGHDHEHEHGEGGPTGLVNGLLGLVPGSS